MVFLYSLICLSYLPVLTLFMLWHSKLFSPSVCGIGTTITTEVEIERENI